MADRSVVIRLRGDISDFSSKMRQAGVTARATLGRELDSITKDKRAALDELGSSAGKIGLAAAAGFTAVVATAANFDQAMSHVAATGDDARQNLEALRDAAIDAGAKTAFSASEAAQGIEALAKAGVSASDTLAGGLQGALDLAAAGTIEVGEAAETAATAMTQFGLSGSDVPHIADLLAAAAGKAQGEVGDMAFALKQSGLVADQVGLSIEETTGALAAFASAGLLGSDAGTSFKTMLGALTPNSAKAAKEMSRLGISAYDASGNFVGLEKFAGLLQSRLSGLTDQQRQSSLETIFGSDAIRAATVLYEQGSQGISGWIDAVDDQGFAAETAATRMDNLRGDLEKLKGSLETAFIGAGEGAQGPLRELVQGLDKAVNLFNELPGPVKNVSTALLGITAILGGGLWFGSKVVRGIADTRDALNTLNIGLRDAEGNATRTGRALKGLSVGAGVVAGLYALDGALKAVNSTMEESIPQGEKLTSRLLDLSDGRVANLGDEFGDFAQNLEDIGTGGLFKVFDGAEAIPGISEAVGLLNNVLPGDSEQEKFREFKEQLEAVDGALAGLVSSGGPDQAKAAFDALASSMNLSATGQRELLNGLPQYEDALAGAANQTRIAAEGSEGAAEGFGIMGDAANEAADDVADLSDAFEKLSGNFLDQREAGRNVRDSLRDIQDALKDYRKEHGSLRNAFKAGTESGDKFAGMLDDLAQDYQNQIDAVFKLTGSERKAQAAYRDSFDALVKTAQQLGRTKAEAERYAKALLGTPKFIKTQLQLDTRGADSAIRSFISSHSGDRITIGVGTKTAATARAEGGAIYGPGTGTSDSIPTLLSNGEHVLTAAEVQAMGGQGAVYAFRRSLKGFAAGGAVVADRVVSSRPAPSGSVLVKLPDGPQRIEGVLTIPGLGEAYIRGVARSEQDASGDMAAMRGRMR